MEKNKSLFRDFSLASVQIIPFVGDLRDMSLAKMAFIYSFGRHLKCNSSDLISQRVCAIGELLALNLNPKRSLNEKNAQQKLVETVRHLVTSEQLSKVSSLDTDKWKQACTKGGFLEQLVNSFENEECWPKTIPVPNQGFIDCEGKDRLSPELAMAILALITINGNPNLKEEVLCLLLSMHLGLLNNGIIPKITTEKINTVETELKLNINLKTDLVQKVHKEYGCDLNDQVAHSIFIFWDTWVDKRIQLFLQPEVKISENKLKSIFTIRKAILAFPDFPWEQLALDSSYLNEFSNISKALKLISSNPYFGYRKDLGIVDPLNYQKVALVAKGLVSQGLENKCKLTYSKNLISEETLKKIQDYFKGKEFKQEEWNKPNEEIKKILNTIKYYCTSNKEAEKQTYNYNIDEIKAKTGSFMKNGSNCNYTSKFC